MADNVSIMTTCWRRLRRNPDLSLFVVGLCLLFWPGLPTVGLGCFAASRGLAPFQVVSPTVWSAFGYCIWVSVLAGAVVQIVAICRFSSRVRGEQELNPAT